MKKILGRFLRMEVLEERVLLAVTAGAFSPFADVSENAAFSEEFSPVDLGNIATAPILDSTPQNTGQGDSNVLNAPVILTGDNGFYVSYGLNNHQITWNEVENAAGYELEFSTDGINWTSVNVVDTHVIVPDLTYGSHVTYRIRALGTCSCSNSDWSSSKTFSVCPMDIDGDDFIGPGDYAILSWAWFANNGDENYRHFADIDGDGEITNADRALLNDNWFKATGDEGLSFPAVSKISITVPVSAVTVPSILKNSANLTVNVDIDASQVSGIRAGDDVTITAVGTYENAENDTAEDLSKDVAVAFSVTGHDAYKYAPIPGMTVAGTVYPYASFTLTADSAKIHWGTGNAIISGQQDVPVTFDEGAITGFINDDYANGDVIVSAVAHYENNINNSDNDITSNVEIRFTLSGKKAAEYTIRNVDTIGTVTVVPVKWYTGCIPYMYADAVGGVGSLTDCQLGTIISGLTGKLEYDTFDFDDSATDYIDFMSNDKFADNAADWIAAGGDPNENYQGYIFFVTNQPGNFYVADANDGDLFGYSKSGTRSFGVTIGGVSYTGYLLNTEVVLNTIAGNKIRKAPAKQLVFNDNPDNPLQIPSILRSSITDTVSFEVDPSYIDGIIDGGSNVAVTATATYPDVETAGSQTVYVTFSLSGSDAGRYLAPDPIWRTGEVTVVWYTGVIPRADLRTVVDRDLYPDQTIGNLISNMDYKLVHYGEVTSSWNTVNYWDPDNGLKDYEGWQFVVTNNYGSFYVTDNSNDTLTCYVRSVSYVDHGVTFHGLLCNDPVATATLSLYDNDRVIIY